jgi:Protein of unknown function (DUF1348)
VRFEHEWHDDSGQWYRSHGNEQWEFDSNDYMARRYASINDQPITEMDRSFVGVEKAEASWLRQRSESRLVQIFTNRISRESANDNVFTELSNF